MATIDEVKNFWGDHINNEIYTNLLRGSTEYFEEIERKRKKFHYYFPEYLEFAGKGAGQRLLEIGCGMGIDLLKFAKNGFQVCGIDLTPIGIELAKKYFKFKHAEADLYVANAEELPFEDDIFDAVYSIGVLHHTPNTEAAIDELYRILRPGGKAMLMLYHKWSLNNLVHILFRIPYEAPKNRKDKCPVVRRFSRRELKEILSKFSGVDIKVEYLFGAGWGFMNLLVPKPIHRALGRIIGWHLVIMAIK